MTGLIIGSLSPDFEYFLRTRVYSTFSHTWLGLFWFDLPLAIVLAFIFHLVVRDKLIDNLPAFLWKRFIVFKKFKWFDYFKNNFLFVIISASFGIATHILWDSFTHEQGQFVQRIDFLKHTFSIAGYSIPLYKLLQHLSTIAGAVIIFFAVSQLPKDEKIRSQKTIFYFWLFVIIISLLFLSIRLFTGLDYKQYGDVIVTIISGGLLGLLVASIFNA